ncbi:hypothetical protein HYPSUDRAFT_209040 [Hypholoma sublateritium FD-334 SS-4]|uniref:Uncharacterized protein n=1 Tax=Hypholoma sublateritium (strain FD-334 SS-4) TaxID=945553 RepID=A0A0D2P041_HYPSF|nr:hypothetical protein HYPSUDRAFT_209040 [Hypholoma sublateritium FD-334 SS-4]
MNYSPGPYKLFPVSGERSETPPPDLDPTHPFTGVELTVSGLPYTSLTSASDHLNQIIRGIISKGTSLPDLQIVAPSTRQPLDFVYVSLVGHLKETPRPDILEEVRCILDSQDGLEARWKVASGRSDKTRQAYFEVGEGLNPLQIKARIDNILRQNHHEFQMSYIPNDSNRIFYHFVNRSSITSLTDTPIRIENRSYLPHRSRFIQPLYGLEVAINGHHFGDASGEPVVRRSRVELDGSVYCVVLSTLQIIQTFLREPFNLFGNSGINPSPPQYLYLLNSAGIPPASFNNRSSSSPATDPSLQRQLDTLTVQCENLGATIRSISDEQKVLSHNFQTAQENITRAFADSTAIYAASNLTTTAQFEVTSLQQSLTTLRLMLVMAHDDQSRAGIQDGLNSLVAQISTATEARNQRAAELRALQSRTLQIPTLPPNQTPALTLPSGDADMHGPNTEANRPPPPASQPPSQTPALLSQPPNQTPPLPSLPPNQTPALTSPSEDTDMHDPNDDSNRAPASGLQPPSKRAKTSEDDEEDEHAKGASTNMQVDTSSKQHAHAG